MDLEAIKQDRNLNELADFSILNIDKPSDCTSFDVSNRVRILLSFLGVKKTGHLGTLDPMVTGVLPVVIGKACKIQEYFMHRDKIYIGKMKLHKSIERKKLEDAMKGFLGKIEQLPPRKSRVKRQVRKREIIEFKLMKFNEKNLEAEFYAHVEAGTYIRKLCSDLGEKLGIGCQMTELRRIKAGIFSDADKEFTDIKELEIAIESCKEGKTELLRKLLIPAEIILKFIDSVNVKEEAVGKLMNGSPLFEEMLEEDEIEKSTKIIDKNEPFAILSGDRIIEIARKTEQFENESILAKPEVVLK